MYTEIERRAHAFWKRSGSRILEVAGVLVGFVEGCCGVLMLDVAVAGEQRSDLIRRESLRDVG